jgi:hypothetical protein
MTRLKAIPLLALLLALCAAPAVAQTAGSGGRSAAPLLTLPASARASALGDAFVAGEGEGATLFYNPARLATIRRSADASVERYFAGSTLSAVAVAARVWTGTVGVGVQSLRYERTEEIFPDGSTGGSRGSPTGRDLSAGELVASVGYALRLRGVDVGAAAKIVAQNLPGTSGSAPAFDAGFSAPIGRRVTIAASAQHLGGDLRVGSTSSPLPRTLRAGGVASLLTDTSTVALSLFAEVRHQESVGGSGASGVEARWRVSPRTVLVGRAGVRGTSGTDARPITAGGGLAIGHLALDYAFRDFTHLGATHRVGIRWTS